MPGKLPWAARARQNRRFSYEERRFGPPQTFRAPHCRPRLFSACFPPVQMPRPPRCGWQPPTRSRKSDKDCARAHGRARYGAFRRKCAQNGLPTHFTPPGRSPCQADQLGEWPNDMNLISLAILRPADRNSLPRARRREARLGTAAGQKTAWADVQARREMRPFQVVPWTPQAPPGEAGLLAWLQLRCVRSSSWQLSPSNCVELRAARNYHNGRSSW